jgi:hypothetical protein
MTLYQLERLFIQAECGYGNSRIVIIIIIIINNNRVRNYELTSAILRGNEGSEENRRNAVEV